MESVRFFEILLEHSPARRSSYVLAVFSLPYSSGRYCSESAMRDACQSSV
uniref:PAG3 protein n=1 Tax=Trypanosoma brucei TaxID=5691 RepID=Q26786_9TRYP|nr:short ORF1 [Trypanosoma brucei brucei]